MSEFSEVNLAFWDERAPAHAASPDYKFAEYASDPDFIGDVVRFDRPRLGDISGLRGVHLQCHIGTDTVSLSRLGARMSGLDFSGEAIEQARRLAKLAGAEIDFHQANVYDAVEVLGAEQYDLVFTGIGALSWLPRIGPWAEVVAGLLKPGGRLFLREGHPMLWALEGLELAYPYFETENPTVFTGQDESYVATEGKFTADVTHDWNHGLGEIITALFQAGLQLTALEEHQTVPWNAIPGHMTQTGDLGEWQLTDRPERLAATYTLQARRTN